LPRKNQIRFPGQRGGSTCAIAQATQKKGEAEGWHDQLVVDVGGTGCGEAEAEKV